MTFTVNESKRKLQAPNPYKGNPSAFTQFITDIPTKFLTQFGFDELRYWGLKEKINKIKIRSFGLGSMSLGIRG